MNIFIVLAVLIVLLIALTFIFVSKIRKARFRRRSVEDLRHVLQSVNEYRQDIESALDPRRQEALKAEWINEVCQSEVCYRREVLDALIFLREYFWRMRRNAIILIEVGDHECRDLGVLHARRRQEARIRLSGLVEAAGGLGKVLTDDVQAGKDLQVLLQTAQRFLETVRLSAGAPSSGQTVQDLEKDSREIIQYLRAALHDNDEAGAILWEFKDGLEKLLADFVLLNNNIEAYRKFRKVTERCSQLLCAMRWPLLQVAFWSQVPLDRLKFLPVPVLASFGNSGGVEIVPAYQRMKLTAIEAVSFLYPGAEVITQRINAVM